MFAENLDVFVNDFGVQVYFGEQTALALFDEPDGATLNQRAISRDYRITYEASKLVGLAHGDTVYIGEGSGGWTFDSTIAPTFDATAGYSMDGASQPGYDVLEVLLLDDGAFYEARLQAQEATLASSTASVRAFPENLDVFINDFGVEVTFGEQTALALFDEPDRAILAGRVISRQYTITYEAAELPDLVKGSTVTIAEVAYSVREVRSIGDGAFFEALLEAQ